MEKNLLAVVVLFAFMAFTTEAFSADVAKPVVPEGPVYATVPVGEIQNDAVKAAKTRETEEAGKTREKGEADARDAKEKADKKAAKAKAAADAAKAGDVVYPATK